MAHATGRGRVVAGAGFGWKRRVVLACSVISAGLPIAAAHAHLQCVPYAREVSGIEIYGNARTWWDQAGDRYPRGSEPVVGAVLAFQSAPAMPLGHVAVVAAILDDRQILLDHANWSGPGVIDRHALAIDVSEAGDWSSVRVWYDPIDALGARDNPTFGFIYSAAPGDIPARGIIASHDPAPSKGDS